MKEQKNILEAYKDMRQTGKQMAIATVVKVRGSSYRSPGARMLISEDGRWVGSISGGCLEGDALRKARKVMQQQKPMTVTYDTREESNQNLGIGLGCNGVIDVFIEPIIYEDASNPISVFEKLIALKEPVAMAKAYSGLHAGEKMILTKDGNTVLSFSDSGLAKCVMPDLNSVFETARSECKAYTIDQHKTEVFIELLQPTISIIIFGGGFDARPVSLLAKSLGWEVMVTDECVAHLAPVFFPNVDKLSLCQRDFIDRDFNVTPYTACVLMSHNYEYDRDVLKRLLRTPAPYIGMLGPRKRFDKMLQEFSAQGIEVTSHDFHRIHSPVGLDIGAETPDEIAVSIIGEIQSKFTTRSGGFLKYNPGPIHQRDHIDQVIKQVYLGLNDSSLSKSS